MVDCGMDDNQDNTISVNVNSEGMNGIESLRSCNSHKKDGVLVNAEKKSSSSHDRKASIELSSTASQTTPKQKGQEGGTINNDPNGDKKISDKEKEETSWEEIWNDSVELENLVFSIHRPSARNRILQLIAGLKLLSEKLQRLDEIQHGLKDKNQKEDNEQQKVSNLLQDQSNQTSKSLKRIFPLISSSETATNINGAKLSNVNTDNTAVTSTNVNSSNKKQRLCKEEQKEQLTPKLSTSNNSTFSSEKLVENQNNGVSDKKSLVSCGENVVDLAAPPTLKKKDKWVQHHANKLRCKVGKQHIPIGNITNIIGQFCPDFEVDHTCPLGSTCKRWHIYNPPGTLNKVIFHKDDLDEVYIKYRTVTLENSDFSEKIKPDGFKRPRYAFRFVCPLDQTNYYSNGIGSKSHKSSQNIWWYFSMSEARDAVATIVITHLIERGIVPKNFQSKKKSFSEQSKVKTKGAIVAKKALLAISSPQNFITAQPLPSTLPLLHPWNWMEIHYKHGRCSKFNSPEGCKYGSSCPLSHVHYTNSLPSSPPSNISLSNLVSQGYFNHFHFRATCLEHTHSQNLPSLRIKSAMDDKNQTWYAAAWQCPVEHIFYYAAGGDGRIQTIQNIFLYFSKEAAKHAIWNIILQAWEARGMKSGLNANQLSLPLTDPRSKILKEISIKQNHRKGKPDAKFFANINTPSLLNQEKKTEREIMTTSLGNRIVSIDAESSAGPASGNAVPNETIKPTNTSVKITSEFVYNEEDINLEDELFGDDELDV